MSTPPRMLRHWHRPSARAVCDDGLGRCTLRAAIQVANASVTGTLDVTANTAEGSGDITFQATGDEKDTDTTNDSSVVTLAFKAGKSSGGCTLQPGGAFDPTLPAVMATGLLGLALRRRIRAGSRDA